MMYYRLEGVRFTNLVFAHGDFLLGTDLSVDKMFAVGAAFSKLYVHHRKFCGLTFVKVK